MPEAHSNEKECENSCPGCGAGTNDIDWGTFHSDSPPYQEGECKVCGCSFHEVYKYHVTTYNNAVDETVKNN